MKQEYSRWKEFVLLLKEARYVLCILPGVLAPILLIMGFTFTWLGWIVYGGIHLLGLWFIIIEDLDLTDAYQSVRRAGIA